jgi:hypothetical protein
MTPDAIISVRFKTNIEGGRRGNVVLTTQPYGCPIVVDEEMFESRFIITNMVLELGKTYELPVKFINPDIVLPKLSIGKTIMFWEGKIIATGKIIWFQEQDANYIG